MLIEIHFVYQNNDVNNNSLGNNYSLNVLEDNEQMALLLTVDKFFQLTEEFLIHNHQLIFQHLILMPKLNLKTNIIKENYILILLTYIPLV